MKKQQHPFLNISISLTGVETTISNKKTPVIIINETGVFLLRKEKLS